MKLAKIVSELERSIIIEEVSWRQKSRVLWLRKVISVLKKKITLWQIPTNGRKNSIDSMLIDGTISTNQAEINEHIGQFYQKFYNNSLVGGF